jgi:hypothetical protein
MSAARPSARRAALLALAAWVGSTLAAPPADAEADVVAALGMRADTRAHAQSCETAAGPVAWQYRWAEYFWESRNLEAFHAADAAVDALPPAQRQALQERIDADASRRGLARKATSIVSLGGSDASSCHDLGMRLTDYSGRHGAFEPGVFEHLAAAYAARQGGPDAVRRELQQQDMVIGCAKSQLKVGKHEFEPLLAFCKCTISAIATSATPAELDAYVASVAQAPADKSAVVASLQKQAWWTDKAVPRVKACGTAPQ